MKYLIIALDYLHSCLKYEDGGYLEIADLEINEKLKREIENWHYEYRKIILLSYGERLEKDSVIKELDLKGLEIANLLNPIIPGGAKI